MATRIERNKKPKFRHKHPILNIVILSTLAIGLSIGAAGTYYIKKTIDQTPKVSLSALKSDASSNMYAGDKVIWSSAQNKRIYVKAKDIPHKYKRLLLDTEDASFYTDKGFSPKGLANAVLSYVKSKLGKGEARGGSSIEQQLIKLSVFSVDSKDRTISRKIKEFFLANQLYSNYSKDQILEYYVNKIAMGENAYGIQTISQVYFGKDLKDLSISQLAIIAGLGQAPSYYNLYDRPDAVKTRRDMVLKSAYTRGDLTKKEYKEALAANVQEGLQPRYWMNTKVNQETLKYDGFVQSTLNEIRQMGYNLETTPLQIQTTLDLNLQDELRTVTENDAWYQGPAMQTALTVVDPKSGYVIAQIGGRHQDKPYSLNRATNRNRSTGSGTKPLVDYGPAIEYLNWSTNHPLDSSPYTYPGTNITATNYGGDRGVGITDMQNALRQSYNTSAIRALDAVGSLKSQTFLKNNGINLEKAPAASDALGINTSTADVATGFASFANGGIYRPTQYVKTLTFADNSVKEIKKPATRSMRESTAFMMTQMLKGVFSEYGTGGKASAMPNMHVAGKTGTVAYDDNAYVPAMSASDVWSNGYIKGASVSMWIGYDNPLAPYGWVTQNYALNLKTQLFKKIMEIVAKGRDTSDWTQPKTVEKISGSNLKSQYRQLDNNVEHGLETMKYQIANQAHYSKTLGKKPKKKIKTKTENKEFEQVPKEYKIGSWKKPLEKEINKYNNSDAHTKAFDADESVTEELRETLAKLQEQNKKEAEDE